MKKINYLKEIISGLNIKKKISENDLISSIEEFDSIGILTFISLADKKFKKKITGDKFLNCKTVNDLIKLLKK